MGLALRAPPTRRGPVVVIMRTLLLTSLLLSGCYAAQTPVAPTDAFTRPDVGTDAWRRDAARAPDAFAPDAFTPDAFVGPDAWLPELGPDCSLGGTQDAFEVSADLPSWAGETRWREDPRHWFTVEVSGIDDADEPDRGILRQLIILRSASDGWLFEFKAPDGSPFLPQVFVDVQDSPAADWGHAGVFVGGGGLGVGCASRRASLTIYEVSVVDGQLRRFRAAFATYCGVPLGTVHGCIRYTAP